MPGGLGILQAARQHGWPSHPVPAGTGRQPLPAHSLETLHTASTQAHLPMQMHVLSTHVRFTGNEQGIDLAPTCSGFIEVVVELYGMVELLASPVALDRTSMARSLSRPSASSKSRLSLLSTLTTCSNGTGSLCASSSGEACASSMSACAVGPGRCRCLAAGAADRVSAANTDVAPVSTSS